MKNLLLKISALTAAVCMTACGGGDTKQTANTSQTEHTILNNPLTLSMHMHLYNTSAGGYAFNSEWPVFKKATELTNISLEPTVPESTTNSQEAFNIMMASGKLPDIVTYLRKDIERYALQGAFVPLEDDIEKYAPNIKAFLDSRSDIKKSITASDGHIYVVPRIGEGTFAKAWFIREDWLQKLNLPTPKTVEEYHDALSAFKTQDPNGNGKADEVPFFNRDANAAVSDLYPLFGVRISWSVKDGVVSYGQYTKQFETAMTNIAKWYSDGLIDTEIFTRGTNSRDILLGDNTGGSTHDWITSTSTYNDKLKDKIDGISFAVIAPPADINGAVWEDSSRAELADEGWAISRDNKNPVETLKYFDFWFSEDGKRLYNFGIEGESYTLEDGKPVFTDEILNGNKPLLQLLNDLGSQVCIGSKQDYTYELQTMNKSATDGAALYIDNGYIAPRFPSLSLSPEEKKTFDAKWVAIDTYVKETTQRWVLGAEPIESNFDKYLNRLKDMGIEECIAIYQQAYDRLVK